MDSAMSTATPDCSTIGRLERAAALLDRGLLTADEFEGIKRHVLSEIFEPSRSCRRWLPEVQVAGEAGCGSGVASTARSAKRQAVVVSGSATPPAPWSYHDDILSEHVFACLDMRSAMQCREVCKRWSRAVAVAKLQPLEAGQSREDVEQGRREQRELTTFFEREAALWADAEHVQRFAKLSNDLEQQHGLNAKMRQILVDWLLELHWNTFEHYLENTAVIHLAVQLVDRYIACKQVQRQNFQVNISICIY